MKGRWITYSPAELAWIEFNRTRLRADAHADFVVQFGRSDISLVNYHALCKRRGWTTGRTGQFAPGNVSHNKGRKGSCAPGCEKGWFKQGVRGGIAAKLYKPIGTERVTIDGYVERKVNDDLPLKNRWAAVHRINWQAAHGPIPAGHRLKCLDGDKSNTTPDNWACIPIAMGPRLNGKHGRGYDTAPAELKPTIMVTTRLEHLARTIKKEAANG